MSKVSLHVPQSARPVLDRFHDAGFEAYIVGGAVRDMLLGRAISDIDIATDALPEEVMQLFPGGLGTGLHHGTVTVRTSDGAQFEVTTFRTDGPYLDGRRPEYVSFTPNLKDDLARRDFTINAMALSRTAELIDPFDGLTHLEHQILCAVGDPYRRFEEDGLRIMRGIRFLSTYGFHVEERTEQAMCECAPRIQAVSLERIGQELWKMAQGDWLKALGTLHRTALFSNLQEPICQLQAALDALIGQLQELHQPELPRGIRALASWFVMSKTDENVIRQIYSRLALGKEMAHDASRICRLTQMLLTNAPAAAEPRNLFQFGRVCFSHAVHLACWFSPKDAPALRETHERVIQTMPIWCLKDLMISGHDIVRHGATGKVVGEVLKQIANDVLTGKVANTKPALERHLQGMLQARQETRYD